jgi:hypothetical protein
MSRFGLQRCAVVLVLDVTWQPVRVVVLLLFWHGSARLWLAGGWRGRNVVVESGVRADKTMQFHHLGKRARLHEMLQPGLENLGEI